MPQKSSSGADFSLDGRIAVITGGAGLLGKRHAEAIARAGGTPVLADLDGERAAYVAGTLATELDSTVGSIQMDVTSEASVSEAHSILLGRYSHIDILVNNAANNPKVEQAGTAFTRFEQFTLDQWQQDLQVGLTGAFLCAQHFGAAMAERREGVIVNISSEYGLIAPDQRLYRVDGRQEHEQPVKPVSYTVAKAGLHGLTIYLATYWATSGIRVNTITLGGVENGQDSEFIARASSRVPMSRMARPTDFQGALVFLCSDASSFVTGSNLIVDGGKSVW